MLWRICAAAILWSGLNVASMPAAADEPQPLPGAYKAIGGGGLVSCGHFVSEMEKGPAGDVMLGTTVISWVAGYLTAYNDSLSRSPEIRGDLSEGLSELDVMDWIADYCSAHSNDVIAVAARELILHLFRAAQNRVRTH
jgi:hypothetical protein